MPDAPESAKLKIQGALRARLDDKSIEAIVGKIVDNAVQGDKNSLDTLVRLLDYQRSVAAW